MNEREYAIAHAAAPLAWPLRLALSRIGRIRAGSIEVFLPGGVRRHIQGQAPGPHAVLHLCNPKAMTRVLRRGEMGFVEGFMARDWDTPELGELLTLLYLNHRYVVPQTRGLNGARVVFNRLQHALRRNHRRGARRNIAYHYDLGNDFYRLWLDQTWTYSSAVFAPDAMATEDLAVAQRRKYDLLLQRLNLKPGQQLLEIGCGWGGFALHAARTTGARVTGITLSSEQLAFARARARECGLEKQVAFELCDYRDVVGRYDAVASIEMYEAVGEAFWPDYFAAIRKALTAGGRAAIQGITIDHNAFPRYRNQVDFIQKFIFPGGMLASAKVFCDAARAQGLEAGDPAFYGAHYAETVRRWQAAVGDAGGAIRQRFDERFLRLWRYYLAYCEAGFRSGNIDLMQITLTRS